MSTDINSESDFPDLDPGVYDEASLPDIDFEGHFPQFDLGFYAGESGTWRKPTSPHEEAAYKAIATHPRILAFLALVD
ncbi:hypothetical protein B0H17DRAFT_1334271 [Mycena rosella]|uniref:Uncharacterized protein n=1 Tax=Mycena rosella TaxID=1033263 RepID=A0AAD7G8K5_MYCRO|nr:hypothetical protein B0H17DRAFT_1334271 [Mycena rosella]